MNGARERRARALFVIAKQPAPGRSKTRLAPALGERGAAELYGCFLRDSLALARAACAAQPDIRPGVLHLPAGAEDFFRRLAPDFRLLAQTGAGLGERLDNALRRLLGDGCAQAVILDSDSPTLPLVSLLDAFTALDAGADVVLGPCDDGGYYLIGLRAPQPRLLREVPMSTPEVTARTLALAAELGLRAACTTPWYDVDTPEELARLAGDLARRPDAAPTTAQFLRERRLIDPLDQRDALGRAPSLPGAALVPAPWESAE
jgi:rSAM/selenodomain-associated transferase 1